MKDQVLAWLVCAHLDLSEQMEAMDGDAHISKLPFTPLKLALKAHCHDFEIWQFVSSSSLMMQADSKPAAQLPPPGPRDGDNAQPHASTSHAPQSSAAQFSNWGPGKPAFSSAQPTSQPPPGLHLPNAPATQPAPGGRLPTAPAAATPGSCFGNGGPPTEAANGRGPQEEAPAKLPAGRGEEGGQVAQGGSGGTSVLAVAPGLPGLPQGVPVDVSVKTR